MGKSKKTRWRTLEIGGSQDETQTNGDVKVNGTNASDSLEPVTSQKYSQILGDHHTNSSTQFSRNSSHHIYKSRNGYNKENYNQRSGSRQNSNGQRSWQRGSNFRTSIVNGKDKKPEEGEKAGSDDAKVDSTAEPKKFNEDEYTRITTPRQDVLFKKGYLSRMNNKTASNLSATVNSTESTAASSTITTSDPDSSVSTLSPATTPSMDFGQVDSMEYAPMYYPGYYDENGMLVIPMYNGYNYYPPTNGSTSPVYLMPYPYQYDPFFMTPGSQAADGDEHTDEKTETDGAKENNQTAENQNGALSTSSEDGASSDHGNVKESKKEATDNGTANPDENISTEPANPELKQTFPIYPNELNGYMYPAYPNGYYNGGYYYYNGMPAPRPPKMRRRKRFVSSRNSQQPRSAETTTDYSDDETTTHTKRYGHPRYQNGWSHHNGYNHFNGKFHRVYVDQNANQAPNEFHLNVDVQEFYPRVQLPETTVNCDAPVDLERKDNATTAAPSPKSKAEAPKVTKTSHPKASTNRVSKKEIIEGIKSMEQQNIDLAATKPGATANANQIDEWNVIKKGKKVKVVKDNVKSELDIQEVKKEVVEEAKIEEVTVKPVILPEVVKKSTSIQQKPKKSKSKNKKKKPQHLLVKQNGFEIIEPEFNSTKTEEVAGEETPEMSDDEPEITEAEVLNVGSELFEELVLSEKDIEGKYTPEVDKTPPEVNEITPEVNDLQKTARKVLDCDDDVIDISDEDICSKSTIPVEELVKVAQEKINLPELAKEIIPEVTEVCFEKKNSAKTSEAVKVDEKLIAQTAPEVKLPLQRIVEPEVSLASQKSTASEVPAEFKKPQTEIKKPELKLEIPAKPEVKLLPEIKQPEVKTTEVKLPEIKVQPEVKVPFSNSIPDNQDKKLDSSVKLPENGRTKAEVNKVQPEVSPKQPEITEKQEIAMKHINCNGKQAEVPQKHIESCKQQPEVVRKQPEDVNKQPEVVEKQPEVRMKSQIIQNSEATKKPEVNQKSEVIKKPEVNKKDAEIMKKTQKSLDSPQIHPELPSSPFDDTYDRTNIAELERDLMENLRLLDDNIDLKSPIINPLFDFPITSAVRKWLQEKQTESFDSLFHVQNLKKLSELYEDEDDDDESDISEKELKSETDSDYASDFQAKANGGSPTCSSHAKGSTKCNKLIAKESFCALM